MWLVTYVIKWACSSTSCSAEDSEPDAVLYSLQVSIPSHCMMCSSPSCNRACALANSVLKCLWLEAEGQTILMTNPGLSKQCQALCHNCYVGYAWMQRDTTRRWALESGSCHSLSPDPAVIQAVEVGCCWLYASPVVKESKLYQPVTVFSHCEPHQQNCAIQNPYLMIWN